MLRSGNVKCEVNRRGHTSMHAACMSGVMHEHATQRGPVLVKVPLPPSTHPLTTTENTEWGTPPCRITPDHEQRT
jgi:hypothetical protein